jgi:hypothetical protein
MGEVSLATVLASKSLAPPEDDDIDQMLPAAAFHSLGYLVLAV